MDVIGFASLFPLFGALFVSLPWARTAHSRGRVAANLSPGIESLAIPPTAKTRRTLAGSYFILEGHKAFFADAAASSGII